MPKDTFNKRWWHHFRSIRLSSTWDTCCPELGIVWNPWMSNISFHILHYQAAVNTEVASPCIDNDPTAWRVRAEERKCTQTVWVGLSWNKEFRRQAGSVCGGGSLACCHHSRGPSCHMQSPLQLHNRSAPGDGLYITLLTLRQQVSSAHPQRTAPWESATPTAWGEGGKCLRPNRKEEMTSCRTRTSSRPFLDCRLL